MAGDWLKFEKATPDKPEVFAIATRLGIDIDAVVGKLFRVWSWFDTHTENGHASSVTPAFLDRIAGVTGMGESMQFVGWLRVTETGISLPNFDRHNGETAKKRALEAKRSAGYRNRHASCVTKNQKQRDLEKRREEKSNSKKQKPLAGKDS